MKPLRVRLVDKHVQANVQKTVSMASASEGASCFFVANLGNLDSAVVERLGKWAVASCVAHTLRRHEDDSVSLHAAKTSAKTARQYQSLLRTLTSHWKMPFGNLDRGWLTLLTDTEYRAAVAGATDHKACATSDHGEVAVASECTVPPLRGLGEASTPGAPKLTKPGASHVILLSLGDGFDERARAAYERLYASDRAVCAA